MFTTKLRKVGGSVMLADAFPDHGHLLAIGRAAGVTEAQAAYVALGRAFAITIEPGGLEIRKGEVALLGPDGLLAAVGEADPTSGWVAPKRVLTGV